MNDTQSTKITGRATFAEDNGLNVERGFSFDDAEGFARYIAANQKYITTITIIK